MCESVGHPVKSLRRVRIGPIVLHKLPRGACRLLSMVEVEKLKKLVGMSDGSPSEESEAPARRAPSTSGPRKAAPPRASRPPAVGKKDAPRRPSGPPSGGKKDAPRRPSGPKRRPKPSA
jgi:23S rRNA pseudouridine2605 synthase